MKIKELQDALNSNRIDLSTLNPVQKILIDKLQQRGLIDTKPLAELELAQAEAKDQLAKEKNLMFDPIKAMTSDKINREKVQMYTDIGVMLGLTLLDRKRLAGAFLNPKKYIAELSKITSNFKNPTLNKLTTGLKQIWAMGKGYGGTGIATTAVRTALAGSLGWTGGGMAYDLADEIVRDMEGLKGEVGDKKYKDMLHKNPLIRSLNDFRIGLQFNAGAELLGPLTAGSMYALRKGFGLETEYSRAMAKIAKDNNLNPTYIMLADPNHIGGKVLKTINRVFGQLPWVGGPAKDAQKRAIEQFNKISGDIFNIQPGMHLATAAAASEKGATQILKRYEYFRNLNDQNFKRVIDMAKVHGDPRVIELNTVRTLMKNLERDALAPPEIKHAFLNPNDLRTPFGQFYAAYRQLVESGRPISITEYIELRTLLNQTTDMLYKNDKAVGTFKSLQSALETDFAKMDLSPGKEISLRYPVQTGEVLEKGGNVVSQEVKSTIGKTGLSEAGKADLKQAIEDAYKFYANNVKTFESRTARIASKFDENALSLKQTQGFTKSGSLEKDQLLKVLSKNIFQMKDGFSFKAVTDLQKLLGADEYAIRPVIDAMGNETFVTTIKKYGTKEGNETLRKLWGAHVGQAYQMSFRQQEKGLMGDWVQAWLGKESTKGVRNGMYNTLEEMKMPNGLPGTNIGKGNMYFDPDVFRKLLLPNEAAATQMKVIFGPQKANKLLKGYDEMLRYMDAVKSYAVPDPSTFLARRLVLGGTGSLMAGASMYGLGLVPTAIMLGLGRYANKILSDPKALNYINKEFKSFLDEPGKYYATSSATRLFGARFANALLSPETGKTYDASDATLEEIFEFFSKNNVPIEKLEDLHMSKKEEETLWPSMTIQEQNASIDDLPPPEYLFGKIGGFPANVEEEKMMTSAVNALPANAPIDKNTLPRQQGLRIPGPGITPVDYSSLFPFDPLGNTIAARRQTRG